MEHTKVPQPHLVRLQYEIDNLFIAHSKQIEELESKYSQHIQDVLAQKSKIHSRLTALYYQQLNSINRQHLQLLGGEGGVPLHIRNDDNSELSNSTTTPPSQTPSNLSINNDHSPYDDHQDSDSFSVSSDESLSSSEDHQPLSSCFGTNNIQQTNIHSNRNPNHQQISMDIDHESDDNDDDNDISRMEITNNPQQSSHNHANSDVSDIEYDIGSDEWLFAYLQNKHHHRHKPLSLNKTQRITLNMSQCNDDKDTMDEISKVIQKMNNYGLFEQCKYISILSPPKSMTHYLFQWIGVLSNVESVYLNDISFFPMVKLLHNIPDTKQLKCVSLCRIELKYPTLGFPEITETFVDEKEINHMLAIMFSCNELVISEWSNPYRAWNAYFAKLKKKFTHHQSEITGALRQKMEGCKIKKLTFVGGTPAEDDIPHSMMQLFIKKYAAHLETLHLDFVDKNLYHACMPWLNQKNIDKNLRFDGLKEMYFVWNHDRGANLLKIVAKTAKHLKTIKLVLPNRELLIKEQNLMKLLEKKTKVERVMAS